MGWIEFKVGAREGGVAILSGIVMKGDSGCIHRIGYQRAYTARESITAVEE